MNTAVIWDLDGTLIDSYDLIVSSIDNLLKKNQLDYSRNSIYEFVKSKSVFDFLEMISLKHNLNQEALRSDYFEYSSLHEEELKPIKNAKEVLDVLTQKGVGNFIYTHKGITTHDVLHYNGMEHYFTEVVTRENGFARKPHPEALHYLINKYSMDKEITYYVGDRVLDVECAKNTGIRSVLLDPEGKMDIEADHIIRDLSELGNIVS